MHAADPDTYFHDPHVAALARAAAAGDTAKVASLVATGTPPNARGDQGLTPLLWATACGSAPGVAALLHAGADPTAQDARSRTPPDIAVDAEDPAVLQAFLDAGLPPDARLPSSGLTLLAEAVRHNRLAQVQALLKAGANPNLTDQAGGNALAKADGSSDYAIDLLLLQAGADPAHRDHGGVSYIDGLRQQPVGLMTASAKAGRQRVLAWLAAHGHAIPP